MNSKKNKDQLRANKAIATLAIIKNSQCIVVPSLSFNSTPCESIAKKRFYYLYIRIVHNM